MIAQLHRGEKRLAFTDSRSQAEELASFLRGQGVETFISHSSLSRDERLRAEQAFQDARDCVIVATSTLELGIDVGDLDRVIQIDAPTKVASFLQRLGRTGRRAGTQRNCLFLATNPHSLVRAAAIEKLWREGWVEPVTPPPFPVHVMAQQALCRVIRTRSDSVPELASFLNDYDGLLDCLLERGMLHDDGGLISIGPEAQRLWGRRNYMELLSVFDTPSSTRFSPATRNSECSTNSASAAKAPSSYSAADPGESRPSTTNTESRTSNPPKIYPAAPRGSAQARACRSRSAKPCARFFFAPTRPFRRAAEHLELLAGPRHHRSRRTVLRATRTGCEWWTYAGLKANAALVAAL